MSTVAAILSRKGNNAITVVPTTTVFHALELMAEKNIGSLVVKEGEQYLGIVTERDYSRKVILKDKHSSDTTVAEIMSTDLPYLSVKDTVEYCMELMSDKNIRYMPVFDQDALVGIISMSDVVKETILQQKETISHLKDYIHGQG